VSPSGDVPASPLTVDSIGMWEATAALPEQIAEAIVTASHVGPLPGIDEVDAIAVVGMGGSGIAGDVLAAAASSHSPKPVAVVKSYELPAWVDARSLVFAVSCSGDTEETLSATEAAWNAGATVIAVTSGGRLADRARANGSTQVPVPPDILQPRAALGAMAVPLLVMAERVGVLPGAADELAVGVDHLQRRRDQLMKKDSVAETLARQIGRTMPLVHGSTGLPLVAAQRWKTQVNENAKAPAFWAAQPELSHNELAGWAQYGDVTRQVLTAVMLRSIDEHPAVARRFDYVAEVMREVVADVLDVWAQGRSPLGRFFDLVMIGDFVSLHLAGRDAIDPGPIPALVDLKDHLRSSP
jgi:glucose/mannose-6-phosphate isomerase